MSRESRAHRGEQGLPGTSFDPADPHTWGATQTFGSVSDAVAVAAINALTGANAHSLLDLAATWNTTGAPTALKLNVTDTASAAAALLMDLQVGGASKFKVDKTGLVSGLRRLDLDNGNQTNVRIGTWKTGNGAGGLLFTSYGSGPANLSFGDFNGSRWRILSTNGGGLILAVNGGVGLDSAKSAFQIEADPSASGAVRSILAIVGNAATPLLQLYATTAALKAAIEYDGSFGIYNAFTDASNYERAVLRWAANLFEIGTAKAGTGSTRKTSLTDVGILMPNLPTSDPAVAGQLWNSAGTLKISAG